MPDRKRNPKTSETEVLYGIHAVREAIRAGRRKIHEIYALKTHSHKRFRQIALLAESHRIPVRWMDAAQFQAVVDAGRHQGVGARVSPYPRVDASRFFNRSCAESPPAFFLLLDSVVDPQNLGALIRTAACVGVDCVGLPKDRSAGPTPAVSRTSAGALEHVAVVQITNLARTITLLKEGGCWIVGLDAAAKDSIFSIDLTVALSIVIGGEQNGIRPLVKKQCDYLVSIPQTGTVDSLNASVAGAIAMYEVYRQRNVPLKLNKL